MPEIGVPSGAPCRARRAFSLADRDAKSMDQWSTSETTGRRLANSRQGGSRSHERGWPGRRPDDGPDYRTRDILLDELAVGSGSSDVKRNGHRQPIAGLYLCPEHPSPSLIVVRDVRPPGKAIAISPGTMADTSRFRSPGRMPVSRHAPELRLQAMVTLQRVASYALWVRTQSSRGSCTPP